MSSKFLTFDSQCSCGGAAACSSVHRAAVLALVPRPGIGDGQHGAPRTHFHIIWQKKSTAGENAPVLMPTCVCSWSNPNLAVAGYWPFSTGLVPLHHCLLGTWSLQTPPGARWPPAAPQRRRPGWRLRTQRQAVRYGVRFGCLLAWFHQTWFTHVKGNLAVSISISAQIFSHWISVQLWTHP